MFTRTSSRVSAPVVIRLSRVTLETDLGFDPDALRERYRQEREKRLRPDGNAQYIEVKGDFSRYVDDRYAF